MLFTFQEEKKITKINERKQLHRGGVALKGFYRVVCRRSRIHVYSVRRCRLLALLKKEIELRWVELEAHKGETTSSGNHSSRNFTFALFESARNCLASLLFFVTPFGLRHFSLAFGFVRGGDFLLAFGFGGTSAIGLVILTPFPSFLVGSPLLESWGFFFITTTNDG